MAIVETAWLSAGVAVLTVGLLAPPAVAQPPGGGAPSTTRVNVSSAGAQDDAGGWDASISADGRFVSFASMGTNLVPEDTNGIIDVFVHDRHRASTTRVSVGPDGRQSNGQSYAAVISGNGRYVAFMSEATNLVPDDTNGEMDVFVHDRHTASTARVSVGSAGQQASRGATNPTISADGRYVTFTSASADLVPGDTNRRFDIFVHDRRRGATSRISRTNSGGQTDGNSYNPQLSADGRYVAYWSEARNLLSGPSDGYANVFVYDRKRRTTEQVSVASDGTPGNDESNQPTISANGRYVAFTTIATNLVPGETRGNYLVVVHDRRTRVTSLVSGPAADDISWEPAISANGRYVAFESRATNLVDGDTNGVFDVFVRDLRSGAIARVSLTAAGGQANDESVGAAISANGRHVAFVSRATDLVPEDTNGAVDVFVRDRGR